MVAQADLEAKLGHWQGKPSRAGPDVPWDPRDVTGSGALRGQASCPPYLLWCHACPCRHVFLARAAWLRSSQGTQFETC